MHLYEENFVKFWLVDIFNFRSSMLPCLGFFSFLTYAQSASYQAGFPAPASGAPDLPNTIDLNPTIDSRFRKIGNRSSWLNKQIRHVPFEKAKELYVRWLAASPFYCH